MYSKKSFTILLCLSLLIGSWLPLYPNFSQLFNNWNKKTIGSLFIAGTVSYYLYSSYKVQQHEIAPNTEAYVHYNQIDNNYAVPADIKAILDSHESELKDFLNKCQEDPDARQGENVCQKSWLPGYYIKYDVKRVSNTQKLKTIIKTNNLNLLSVPQKYLYHIPSAPDKLSNENYVVIAKAIDRPSKKNQLLNVKQAEQLCRLALLAHHYDLIPSNYIIQQNGTVVIIDTDSFAMPSSQEVAHRQEDWLLHGTKIVTQNRVSMNPQHLNDPLNVLQRQLFSKHHQYSSEAYTYIDNEIKKRETYRLKQKLLRSFCSLFTYSS